MAISRNDTEAVVSQLQGEISRMFGNLNDPEGSSATAEWIPAVDVREYAAHFELLIDLPGVDPKTVDITMDNGLLTISGERRDSKRVQGNNQEPARQQRNERRIGRFYRRFVLPDTVDAEKVVAAGRDGVLEISIQKQPRAQPRRISVNS